jgi:hypothetical protein
MGYTCDELAGYYIDCALCEEDGSCDAGFECQDGSIADTPEDCEACAYDWSNYGAAFCDAAWDSFGISCADLEANYGWDGTGCSCPGDVVAYCGDGECNGDEDYTTCPDDCDAPEACADGETAYTLVVGGGSYDSEMGWSLDDADGNLIATAGCDNPNYYGICEGGGNGTFELCLTEGFYSFYGYDSYGDGWNGGYWEMFDADGNSAAGGPDYTITEANYYGWGWGWGCRVSISIKHLPISTIPAIAI